MLSQVDKELIINKLVVQSKKYICIHLLNIEQVRDVSARVVSTSIALAIGLQRLLAIEMFWIKQLLGAVDCARVTLVTFDGKHEPCVLSQSL